MVNRKYLLSTETWRHSMFGSVLCQIRSEKHHTAFVKVVEGSEIYNFPIHYFVHFYSTFWSYTCSNRDTGKQFGRAVPCRASAHATRYHPPVPLGAVRRPRPRLSRPRTSGGVRAPGLVAPARAARRHACPARGCSPSVPPCSKSGSSSIKRLSPRFPRADRSAMAA
jgi:hypothetical protein